MNFLTRFLKIFFFALVLTGLGGLVFYWLVISGSKMSADATPDQFRSAVGYAVGYWIGFIFMLSIFMAFMGRKTTLTLDVHDINTFVYRLNDEMTKLRYRLHKQTEDALIFKPPALNPLAEKVSARFGENSVVISGPSTLLIKLKQKL